MNKKLYGLIWNRSLRQVVVVSELASVHRGAGSAGGAAGRPRGWRRAALAAALVPLSGLAFPVVAANPPPVAAAPAATPAHPDRVRDGLAAASVVRATEDRHPADEGDDDRPVFGLAQAYPALLGAFAAGGGMAPAAGMQPLANTGSYCLGFDNQDGSGSLATACGWYSRATGANSAAFGGTATASGSDTTAVGKYAVASGKSTGAFGRGVKATGNYSIAVGGWVDLNHDGVVDAGEYTVASGASSSAFGVRARATGNFSTALGNRATVEEPEGTAVGMGSDAGGYSVGVGAFSRALRVAGVAVGASSYVNAPYGVAVGFATAALGEDATALGAGARAVGRKAVAIGYRSTAGGSTTGAQAFALGSYASATGNNSTALGGAIDLNANGVIDPGEYTAAKGGLSMALGSASQATQNNATAIGGQAQATGVGATAVGSTSIASGVAAATLGFGAQASADGSVAIGWNSIAAMSNTVSFGGNGVYRELVNVADPTTAHSAVTLGYLQSHYTGHTDFADLSAEIDRLSQALAQVQRGGSAAAADAPSESAAALPRESAAAPPAAESSGPPGPRPAGVASASADDARPVPPSPESALDPQTQDALRSAREYAGTADSRAVAAAKAYTDAALADYVTADTFNQYQQQVAGRFHETDERINKISAMSTAMVQMAASAAGIDTPNRVGVGVGATHGKSAVAIGYQRAIGRNATVTVGGSATSGESTVGAGVGFGW